MIKFKRDPNAALAPRISWKSGYWGATVPCYRDDRFRRTILALNHLYKGAILEHRVTTTHVLKDGAGFHVAKASGQLLQAVLVTLWTEFGECCSRKLAPYWPKSSQVVGEDGEMVDDDEPGMLHLKEQALGELKTLIQMACKYATKRQQSLYPYGVELLAGLLHKNPPLAIEACDKALAQWRAIRVMERNQDEFKDPLRKIGIIRKNSQSRSAYIVLEQEEIENRSATMASGTAAFQRKARWGKTEAIMHSLYNKGYCTTKPCEDSFAQLKKVKSCNKGLSNISFGRATYSLMAHNLYGQLSTKEQEDALERAKQLDNNLPADGQLRYNTDDPFYAILDEEEDSIVPKKFLKSGHFLFN